MTDIFSKVKRSEIMSNVKSNGNRSTELKLLEILRSNRIAGWRRKKVIFGRPDFVFPRKRLAVFVDGCFWHGCQDHGSIPKTNRAFWVKKLHRNKLRDLKVNRTLKALGWKTLRIWQHELKQSERVARRLQAALERANKPSS